MPIEQAPKINPGGLVSRHLSIALAVLVTVISQENGRVTNRDRTHARRDSPGLLAVTRGTEHGCGLGSDGRAYCWGSNRLGQLGDDGEATPRSSGTVSVAVATAQTFVGISAGANHTCALTRDGEAYCWGLNLTGELGQALVANECSGFPCSRRPVRVDTSIRFDTLSAGFGHTCGLSDGTAFCWGRNDRGQLGTSRADDRCDGVACNIAPVRVVGIERFMSISAGGDHTCGIADGIAYCWGSNQYGQLGVDAGISSSTRPLRLSTTEPVISVEARGIQTCAVTASGKRPCWGLRPPGDL